MKESSKSSPADQHESMTDGQWALVEMIQDLDPNLTHTLKVECRGTEPLKVERLSQQTDKILGRE